MQRQFILSGEAQAESLWAFLKNNWKVLAATSKPLLVTVEQYSKKRSNKQNSRYWAIVQQIAENGWVNGRKYDSETWHDFLKGHFIGYDDLPFGGKRPLSSATLNTEEFNVYMEKVELFAREELGIPIDQF